MANQGHTYGGIRTMREWYEAGVLGTVKEVHCGYGAEPNYRSRYKAFVRPGMPLPKQPVPADLNWDLWIGPAAMTDYNGAYQPATWRSFWPFGSAVLGDWFCHVADGPVWVLDLYDPTVIECLEKSENAPGVIPNSAVVRWEFPKRGEREACSRRQRGDDAHGGEAGGREERVEGAGAEGA